MNRSFGIPVLAAILAGASVLAPPVAAEYMHYTVTAGSTLPKAGETFAVTYALDDAISFSVLNAKIGWDASLLTPIGGFFQPGPVLTGLTTQYQIIGGTVAISAMPGLSSEASGPGELFSLIFEVNPGLATETLTHVDFVAGDIPTGLRLTARDVVGNVDIEYTRSPLALDSLSVLLYPVPANGVPEPASALLFLAGLGAWSRGRTLRRPGRASATAQQGVGQSGGHPVLLRLGEPEPER